MEGLEAFTEYWFELLNYAYVTNDAAPLKAVTDEGCVSCKNIQSSIQNLHERGQWQSGGELNLQSFNSAFELNTAGSIYSFIETTQDSITYFESDGSVFREQPAQTEPSVSSTIAFYDVDSWLMLDVGKPEGT